MKKKKVILVFLFLLLLFGAYYIYIPAISIHSMDLWVFVLFILVLVQVVYAGRHLLLGKLNQIHKRQWRTNQKINLFSDKFMKIGRWITLGVFLVFVLGIFWSSSIINAKRYQKILSVEKRNFTEDIAPAQFDNIPLLDRESAIKLGNRKMGSMVDMVSQFEVSSLYSQINYKGIPVRVTPLVYANTIKWLTNRKEGIPAYIMIDMATEDTSLVKLDKGIKYSKSEPLNRNIYRHLRFKYPTYIFDQISFEIDDEGTPFWVCPVKKYTVGWFGGPSIGRVVLCNAVTGQVQDYPIEKCPKWVDKAYPADLLIRLYDYHGTLKNGYLNSILGQKGCLVTTDGYNYIAMDDDVWVYTGITSVSGDLSNVGFVLINQRTKECRYYEVNGAEEYSAMESAQGQVQHLKYKATFPLLINVGGDPTYFMALKDKAGLVKKYALVNVEKYQNVSIGDTVLESQKDYLAKNAGGKNGSEDLIQTKTGKIKRIAQSVVDGNSHFYVSLENGEEVFDIPVTEFIEIVTYSEGDEITIEYAPNSPLCLVYDIK